MRAARRRAAGAFGFPSPSVLLSSDHKRFRIRGRRGAYYQAEALRIEVAEGGTERGQYTADLLERARPTELLEDTTWHTDNKPLQSPQAAPIRSEPLQFRQELRAPPPGDDYFGGAVLNEAKSLGHLLELALGSQRLDAALVEGCGRV